MLKNKTQSLSYIIQMYNYCIPVLYIQTINLLCMHRYAYCVSKYTTFKAGNIPQVTSVECPSYPLMKAGISGFNDTIVMMTQ